MSIEGKIIAKSTYFNGPYNKDTNGEEPKDTVRKTYPL